MAKLSPGFIADQEAGFARQRAAGRQKEIKKSNDPSNVGRSSKDVRGYKVATKQNWQRAAEEARLTGAARVAAIQQARAKAKGKK